MAMYASIDSHDRKYPKYYVQRNFQVDKISGRTKTVTNKIRM